MGNHPTQLLTPTFSFPSLPFLSFPFLSFSLPTCGFVSFFSSCLSCDPQDPFFLGALDLSFLFFSLPGYLHFSFPFLSFFLSFYSFSMLPSLQFHPSLDTFTNKSLTRHETQGRRLSNRGWNMAWLYGYLQWTISLTRHETEDRRLSNRGWNMAWLYGSLWMINNNNISTLDSGVWIYSCQRIWWIIHWNHQKFSKQTIYQFSKMSCSLLLENWLTHLTYRWEEGKNFGKKDMG